MTLEVPFNSGSKYHIKVISMKQTPEPLMMNSGAFTSSKNWEMKQINCSGPYENPVLAGCYLKLVCLTWYNQRYLTLHKITLHMQTG